jgi:hypothetical protein
MQTNLSHHPVATNAPGIWHTTCTKQIDDFPYGQITRMPPPRIGLNNDAKTRLSRCARVNIAISSSCTRVAAAELCLF